MLKLVEILANDRLLGKKIELGEKILKMLTNTGIKEESLFKNTKKLLICIKGERLQSTQMMISNFILGSNKRWV